MNVEIVPTIYVMGTSCELMDKIRREANYWSDGDENICLTFDEAMEVEELHPYIQDIKNAGDVIVSK